MFRGFSESLACSPILFLSNDNIYQEKKAQLKKDS